MMMGTPVAQNSAEEREGRVPVPFLHVQNTQKIVALSYPEFSPVREGKKPQKRHVLSVERKSVLKGYWTKWQKGKMPSQKRLGGESELISSLPFQVGTNKRWARWRHPKDGDGIPLDWSPFAHLPVPSFCSQWSMEFLPISN
jgi:hypothetical protein